MIPWVKSKAKLACLGLCLALAQTSVAGSAANEHVTVTCEAPRIPVEVNGTQFNVFAPGYPDSFVTNVMVVANGNWKLEKPTRAELPLKMRGGDTASYKVTREPEDEACGTIAFHNYYIKSNIDGGAKDIVVKAGDSVTYTAYKNGGTCSSDWAVNGEARNNTSSIIFNRSWWNVPAWFIPSMDTPKPGVYCIHAHDVQHTSLEDSGTMILVGIDRLEANVNGTGYVQASNPLYIEKGTPLTLKAFPDPNSASWPNGTPIWTRAIPLATGSDEASVDTAAVETFDVAASCGDSSKTMQIVVYECKASIYAKSPSEDAPIALSLSLKSSEKFELDVGHTSWKLEVSPSSAKAHIQSLCATSNAKHLNVCVGYYPNGGVGLSNLTPLGILKSGDSSEGAVKAFEITTSQLVTGLEHT